MKRRLRLMLTGGNISPPALFLMRLALRLSCAILALALLVQVRAGPLTAGNVYIHRLAADLYRAPLGVLLAAFVGALIVDALMRDGR